MAITDLDEQLLVRAHQAGDEHAFGQIVRSQHRALYAHAFRRLGSHEAAEDAVQDTLLRAYRALPSFDGDLRLRAWLHRILTNVCHDEGNRRRRAAGLIEKLEAQPEELAPDPIEETVLHDTVRVMNEALAELPDSYREALVLRYVDGLSFKEVGEVTGISEENARARVHRGRLALNKILSRVTVLLAFIIPGLRSRAEKALDADVNALSGASAAEPAISLSTRLASHVTASAPVLERVANEGSTLVAAKSSVVATSVAAIAAVSAPVVAYQVYDTATAPPERPPAAVAAPATDTTVPAPPATTEQESTTTTALAGEVAIDGIDSPEEIGLPADTPIIGTDGELPPSVTDPFAEEDDEEDGEATDESTTTTTAPPPPAKVEATVRGDDVVVTGTRPDFDLTSAAALDGEDLDAVGTLSGSLYVAEAIGDDASAELELVLEDGRTYRIRFRGALIEETHGDGATTLVLAGTYRIPDGGSLGLADSGDAIVRFVDQGEGKASSITFELHGTQTKG